MPALFVHISCRIQELLFSEPTRKRGAGYFCKMIFPVMCMARPLTGHRHVTVLLLVIRNATVKSRAVMKTQPFLFIFMKTPCGTATTLVTVTGDDSFFFRIHIRSPTSLWRCGSTLPESALNCGCQSCLPAIRHQCEHSKLLQHSRSCYVDYMRPPAAHLCRVLTQRRSVSLWSY